MTSLIVFRLAQGVAAGLMLPMVITLLVQAAGRERLGRLMGIATLPLAVVPIFGPVVGGVLVNNLDWRWIFYVNVPICLAAIALAWRLVPADGPRPAKKPLDVAGLAMLSPAMALLIYGLSKASGSGGFSSRAVLVPLAIGLVLGCVFVVYALRKKVAPIVNLRVFHVRPYAASVTVFFLAGLSLYGPLLLLALYYQQVQGKSALMAGLLLAPQGIGSLVPRTVAGRLTDRIGPRLVVVTGLALTALGTVAFTQAGPNANEWLLAASLMVRGAGLAGVTIAVMAGAFQGVQPSDVPDASTTTRIVQQVGGSFGAAVLALILARGLSSHLVTVSARAGAFDTAFWWSIGFTVLALIPAFLLPSTAKARRQEAGSPTSASKA
jgi:EmrB/QacA subfamily drug resistance transporter